MRGLRLAAAALGVLAVAVVAYLSVSMWRALDHDRTYTAEVVALPVFGGTDGLVQIPSNGYRFRARLSGFEATPEGPAVILLHGFPVTSAMWLPLERALANAGFRTVAIDQRGYSPGARPDKVTAYRMEHLLADVLALADALDLGQFHLVGHDWGAMVGWQLTRQSPEHILSWTALSMPHPLALAQAMDTDSDQQGRSRYMRWLQLPWLPEVLIARDNFAVLRAFGESQQPEQSREYLRMFAEPGAVTAALNWYRAMPNDLRLWGGGEDPIEVPTLFLWGRDDPVVARSAVDAQARFLGKLYRSVELEAAHRPLSEQTTRVVDEVLAHLMAVQSATP